MHYILAPQGKFCGILRDGTDGMDELGAFGEVDEVESRFGCRVCRSG